MKRILGLKNIINLTLAVMLIGGVVFSLGFGICLYLAREEVKREASMTMEANIEHMRCYVDGQLQRVEDAAYTMLCSEFGNTVRDDNDKCHVAIDSLRYSRPTANQMLALLSRFLDANPHVCGAAIGFEDNVYPEYNAKHGFALYVTNVSGRKDTLQLGQMHDFKSREWYKDPAKSNSSHWSMPYRETSAGKVVTCFSVPLYGEKNRLVGVFAVDIDNEAFRTKCTQVAPFPGSEVAMLDRSFRFVAYPDPAYDLKSIDDIPEYDAYENMDTACVNDFRNHRAGHCEVNSGTSKEALYYFTPIERTGWTITIESPNNVIMSSISRMKWQTTVIAILSILFMIVCFVWLFRRMQGVAMDKASLDSELKIASGIQMGMLPKQYPAYPERDDVDVCGYICPAKSVGGDLYDYFIRDNKLYFSIGDVSGKGVPASLFMAVIHALFRNVTQHESNPRKIVTALNDALVERNEHNMFCTMFMGVLNLVTGELQYCNAGHCAPVLVHRAADGLPRVAQLTVETNIAIGVIEAFPYKGQSVSLHKGDGLFLYTDGVSEAENLEKVLYGDNAVLNSLACINAELETLTAKDIIDSVIDDLSRHVEDAEQSDDITMLMVEYNGPQQLDFQLHLTNDIGQVTLLAEWVETMGEKASLPSDMVFNLNLALEEAVVNVISYAYGEKKGMPIDLNATVTDGIVEVTIIDKGAPFDPTQAADPDLSLSVEDRPIGGLGIMLVRKLASQVVYKREDECNVLTLTFLTDK